MNKYSRLSDFEINKLVAKEVGLFPFIIINEFGQDMIFSTDSGIIYCGFEIKRGHKFDVINNYEHSFNLFINSDMSLIKHPDFYDAVYRFGDFKPVRSTNINPCRAIAECFLLMKDAERGDEKNT